MKNRLLLLALFFAQMLHAQWEQLPMPDGGDIQFLGTAHNRVWTKCSDRNYFSDDEGLTWQPWTLPSSVEPGKIWISDMDLMTISHTPANTPEGYEDAILRSVDNGDSWQTIFYDTLHQFHIEQVFSAGNYLFFVDGGGWNDSLYRSSDLGASWQYVKGEFQLSVTAGNNVLLASYYKDNGVCGYDFVQIRSVDFGQTWQSLSIGGSNSFLAGNYWILWDYDAQSIYFSNNSGATFSTVPRSSCRAKYFYAPPYSLYAYDGNVGCIQHWDNGIHAWQPTTTPPANFSYFVQTEGGSLLVGMHGKGGVWRTPDVAIEWSEANNGLLSSGVKNLLVHKDHFFISNETGVHRSINNCHTWNEKSPSDEVSDLHFWGDTLLATGDEKIFFSADEGDSWAPFFHTRPVSGSVQTFGDSMFWMVQGLVKRNLYYTPDRGATSHILAPPLALAGAILLDYFVFQGRIWASLDTDQIFYSDDTGQSWISSGISVAQCSFFNQNEHFFLKGESFLYSADAGVSWIPSSGLPVGKFISSLKNDENNRWYALVKDAGIFVSDDFGANWIFWDDPGSPEVYSIYPQGSYLYASRNKAGLWRKLLVSSFTITPEDAMASRLLLFPNPSIYEVEIKWPTDTPPESPVFVYELYGKLILQTKRGYFPALKLDVSTWSSGFYFVKSGSCIAQLVKK